MILSVNTEKLPDEDWTNRNYRLHLLKIEVQGYINKFMRTKGWRKLQRPKSISEEERVYFLALKDFMADNGVDARLFMWRAKTYRRNDFMIQIIMEGPTDLLFNMMVNK